MTKSVVGFGGRASFVEGDGAKEAGGIVGLAWRLSVGGGKGGQSAAAVAPAP